MLASTYEVLAENGNEIEVIVELEETIYYLQDWKINSEVVFHTITLMYDEKNVPVVVSDSYYEEYSEYISASYVNPYVALFADAVGSDECIVAVAETQIGYLEKKSNSQLDSFEANPGGNNYTKYGQWYGLNGQAWCAMFVSWCANQANIPTSIVYKTASCDYSMNFYKNKGLFEKSSAYGGNYIPKAGDIFFRGPNQSNSTHTGLVVGVSGSNVIVIHGNSKGANDTYEKVRKSTYSLNDSALLGYGTPQYASDTHSYITHYDSAKHWKVCTACGYQTGEVAHTYTLKSDTTGHWNECDGCGLCNEKIAHNSTHHWGSCSKCGHSVGQTGHTHTYVSNEQGHWSKCRECNYNYGTSVTTHTYKWVCNGTYHWKVCSVCGYKTQETAHTWKDMGTCLKCSQCGKTQIKEHVALAVGA